MKKLGDVKKGDTLLATKVFEEKFINPEEHEIISWELNGKTSNYDYYK